MSIDWTKDTWADFFERTKQREIIVYGSGHIAAGVVWLLERKRKIIHIVDSDSSKIGTTFYGYMIENPDEVFIQKSNVVVLICSRYVTDIFNRVRKYGKYECFSAFFMERRDLKNEIMTELPSEADMARLRVLLTDDRSREILEKIVEKRREKEIDYSDIMTSDEYLREEFFQFNEDEIYVDAGAFNGDTILDFLRIEHGAKKIYGFEADPVNFKKMETRLGLVKQMYNIECFDLALADYNGKLNFFSMGNMSSKADATGRDNNMSVNCVTLDSMIKEATYIKMDIEGSELNALRGANKLIKSSKPKMAICIYHRPSDLWEIPLYLHSLVPEYKMHIRHHGNVYYDTVLYVHL